jgi:hypothetical protein
MNCDDASDPRESLALAVAPLAARIRELQNLVVRECEPIVGRLIRSGSRDVRAIETMLDRLLDVACAPDGLKLFKSLCRHYYFIYPASAAFYVQSYRELWGDELEDKG